MNSYEALKRHAAALQKQLEDHRQLLDQAEREKGSYINFCPHLRCPHQRQLHHALKDVVNTLEETRKAFKSKQLEQLRRRMLDVLYTTHDENGPG